MRYFCHCLNVSIDVLEINNDKEATRGSIPVDLAQIINLQQEWLLCDVPSERSVHVTWQSLQQALPVREMKVYRCVGCQLYTHVTNIGPSRMLINQELWDETTINTVYRDPSYSRIAKIVLPNKPNSTGVARFSNSQDENLQRECEVAQQACRQAIEDVERETEEKIRVYQREQEEILQRKTDNLNKELDRFLNLMRSVSRHPSNTRGSPTSQSSSSYINENSTESGFGSDIFDLSTAEFGRHSTNIERTLSERNANIDEETTDDPMLDNGGWYIDSSNISNFATSLPKAIVFPVSSKFTIPKADEDSADDIERIGKSFRDLSRSMCTDGTELFGELPSPRLNARPT